jgi:alkanesulfonate monooxygenase SsuD/methylene tetrahydromethanopterin reductase-like flavin-dependent oxidoreductase (luciferase family)
MKFGVFDQMDRSGPDLGQLYQNRLALVEAYDRAGFYGYHVAEHHGTPLGCRRRRVSSYRPSRSALNASGLARWSTS